MDIRTIEDAPSFVHDEQIREDTRRQLAAMGINRDPVTTETLLKVLRSPYCWIATVVLGGIAIVLWNFH
jgi:hypothetical protein